MIRQKKSKRGVFKWIHNKSGVAWELVALALVVLVIVIPFLVFGLFWLGVDVGHAAIIVKPLSGRLSDPILGPYQGLGINRLALQRKVDIYYATDTLGNLL